MTVSNVLRGRRDVVAEATRERVLQAVRELDYVPVRSTVQNRHVETRIIGLVFEHQAMNHHPMGVGTYEGLCERAAEHGYDLLTLLRADHDWVLDREELRFLDRRCDGFIFFSGWVGKWQDALKALVKHDIPTVVCFRRDVPKGIARVGIDNTQAMQVAVDHLVQHGHRRIAHMAAPVSNFDSIERRKLFRTAMRRHRLDEYSKCVVEGMLPNWHVDYDNALVKLRAAKATAVVAFNDKLALGLWEAATRAGLQVPRDLSIVGMDDTQDATEKGLTTVRISFHDVGRMAVDAWLALHQGRTACEHSEGVQGTLIKRQSVGAPPSRGSK
jgi:DNA-binding LacI/PurR family transcriptional regulator